MRNIRPQTIVFCLVILLAVSWLFLWETSRAQANNELLPTSVEVIVACGNGLIEYYNDEVCDVGDPPEIPMNLGTTTCSDFDDVYGDPYQSGSLDCKSDCSAFITSGCYTCGNGHKEEAEECDGNDFGGESCLTFGFDKGSLVCTNNCKISTMNCEAMESEGGLPGAGGGGGGGGSGSTDSGYDPGMDEDIETKVVVKGKAYPHADVHILVDGKVIGIVEADSKADFYFESTEIPSGVNSFGFWSEDPDGLRSTLLTLTFRVLTGSVTTISGVHISPTIDVSSKSVVKGESVDIYGHTIPETDVHVHINSEEEFVEKTQSQDTGEWKLTFDTSPLAEEFHTAKALFRMDAGNNVVKSGFSKSVSFHVGKVGGEAACPEADLNKDDSVNLTDFSMLLYNWGTDDPCADQNQNGTVDLIDFSIMMYYWTG